MNVPEAPPQINRRHRFIIQSDLYLLRALCLPICGEALKSLLILFPRLDRYIVNVHRAERIDKRARQAGISDQRDVEVDSGTTDLVTIVQFGMR